VRLAARGAAVTRDAPYKRAKVSPTFAAAWAQAEQDAIDVLAAEARRRALSASDALLYVPSSGAPTGPIPRTGRCRLDVRREAERIAAELDGVSADEIIAEAERIARGGGGR